MTYQSHRECKARYEAIRPLLARYKRPFTVLEYGPAEGYFAARIAEEFPASTVVMIERHAHLCRQTPGTIFLNREVTAEDLEHLAACEHFDVVLAMSVLHHIKEPGRGFRAILTMGDHVLFETPPVEDTVAWNGRTVELWEAVGPVEKTLLVETRGLAAGSMRPLWHIETPKNRILQPDLARVRQHGVTPSKTMGAMRIDSTFEHKRVAFGAKGEERDWLPGINLLTYCWWSGTWPERGTVAGWVRSTRVDEPHGDMRPWNFVLSGRGCHLIDGAHHDCEDDAVALERTARAVMNGGRYVEDAA